MTIKTIRMFMMLGLLLVVLIPTVSAQQTNISLPIDASAEHGDTVVVPLMANNVTNLAGFDVDITYNPLVVNVTGVNVNNSFGGSSADALCNLKNAGQGSVKLVSANFGDYACTGDCHLVDITLEAVGTADQTTELSIIINNAYNPDNDPIDPYPVASNGTFEVGGIAESTTISLPLDASAEHGDTVVVPLMANNVTNLAGFDVDITYNPLVVNVTGVNVNNSFGGSSADALCNLKNAGQGSVKLVSANFGDYACTGDCHLVDITLEAVGTADQTTELSIIINNAYNPDNDPIDPYPVASNGTFEVNGSEADTTGDIVINEIMYNPAGDEKWYEWIELYNNDTKDINVDGWTLNGTLGGSDTVLNGTMSAGAYLLIARNATAFQDRYPDVTCPIIKGNWSALANTNGDTIDLWDSTPAPIDTVTYTDIASENYTAERNATGGWDESHVDGGTPCAENSVLGELLSLDITAVPTSVTNNTTTEVKFNVTSEGAPVDDALVTLTGCGADTSGTTGTDGIATISVTANATGTIGVTATKTGYDEATTTVTVTAGVTTSPLNVTAVPTSVTNNTATEVKFNVTSEGAPVDDALVTLTGCGADTSGTTGTDGIATISVTANATGTIGVTATKTGYDEATTTVTVTAGVTTSPLNVTAVPTSVTNNTTTEVKFNVTSEGAPVDDALVTLTGCGADTSGTTGTDGIATISVTANATGTIGVTATKTGYDEATTTVTVAEVVTTSPLNVTADPTSVTNNTATEVKFNVTSEGAPVEGALVTLSGCGADTSGTTGADGIATISVTANATGTIGVTATKTGYDEATTTVTVAEVVTTSPLNVTADPTSVTNNTATEVKFNVTSEGAPVEGALVTLSGCGADTSGTTGADGIATISVTANDTGAIGVTATKTGYVDAVTTITVNGPESSGNNTTPVISDFVNVTGNYTGTAYVKALGDPTGEVGTTIGLGDDMIPFKGANVTIDQSLDAGEWVRIEMSYTDDELGDIDEDYLEIYKFNKTAGVSGEWELVKEQQYCIDHDKNKADNYLWVKVDELSIFTRAGKEKVPPTSTPTTTGGGGGSGTYPPGWDDDAPASTPAATTAPTDAAPEPTEAPTDGAPTEAPTDEVSTEAPTTEMKTKGTPGFGAVVTVFAIAGLLVATYLVMRRRE